MKLIVGLGNPGSQYERTRHNAGFMAVARLVRRYGTDPTPRSKFSGMCFDARIGTEKSLLLMPTTYMNLSGRSVVEALNFYKLDVGEDLLVLVDEAALPCGTIRVRASGGDGGHNGLADIERALGTHQYPRLRIGVGPKPSHYDLVDFVLGRFTDDELRTVEDSLDVACDAVESFVEAGVTETMNRFNRRVGPEPAPETETESK